MVAPAQWEPYNCKRGYKGLLPRLATQLREGPTRPLTPSAVLHHLCLLALIQEHFLEHLQLDLLGTVNSFTDYANFCFSVFSFDVHKFLAIWGLPIELLIQIHRSLMLLLLAKWRRSQNRFQLWPSQKTD